MTRTKQIIDRLEYPTLQYDGGLPRGQADALPTMEFPKDFDKNGGA